VNSTEVALRELEGRLRAAGAPVLESLRPGLPRAHAKRLLAALPGPTAGALVDLYCWHDGATQELFPLLRFHSLADALGMRGFELGLAAEVAQEGGRAADIFDPSWFPVFDDPSGNVYIVERLGAGAVVLIDREDMNSRDELAPSLAAFVDRIGPEGFEPMPLIDPVAALVAQLEDPATLPKATRELTRRRPPAAFEPLVALLRRSPEGQARRNAALLLGELHNPRAIPILIRCLAEWEGRDLISAAAGLQNCAREDVFGLLERTAATGDPELRSLATAALASVRALGSG
jgi:hypothetical protein